MESKDKLANGLQPDGWEQCGIINIDNCSMILACQHTDGVNRIDIALFNIERKCDLKYEMCLSASRVPKKYIKIADEETSDYVDLTESHYYIDDIGSTPSVGFNKGCGSILINKLIEFAKSVDVYKIKGFISGADRDHWDRLESFYKKNGFSISQEIDGEKQIELIIANE